MFSPIVDGYPANATCKVNVVGGHCISIPANFNVEVTFNPMASGQVLTNIPENVRLNF